MLKLPVINKSKTMAGVRETSIGVRETSIDERRKTDKDKDIDGVSAERINNRVPQNPEGRKYERLSSAVPPPHLADRYPTELPSAS
jgi:hypothetical protein